MVLAAGIGLCPRQAQAQEEDSAAGTADSVQLEPGIVFGTGGEEELKLDLARPQRGGPFPAVICLHGGGWVGGSRAQMEQTIRVLAGRGYVAISPDYRLAPQARFPAQLEDCKTAVRWLRANAARYRIRSDRIGVMGLAAGAHLACLLGLTDPRDGLEGTGGHSKFSSRVQAVVSFVAPTDLAQPGWSQDVLSQNLLPLLGAHPEDDPMLYRAASPVNYAGRPNAPPFLLMHGTADRIVPFKQAQDLADLLEQAGSKVQLVPIVDAGHGWSPKQRLESIARMIVFFDDHLKQ
jgi:acetyl esterase/lipase